MESACPIVFPRTIHVGALTINDRNICLSPVTAGVALTGKTPRNGSVSLKRAPLDQKTILVISVGLSPQVVTEAVYALACEKGERLDEIHMWTTTGGEQAIHRDLLDGGNGALYRLFKDYGLPVPEIHIRVFGRRADAPAGLGLTVDQPLEDIRSGRDNELVADTLMHFFHELTRDVRCRLLCCLAGARKTIGAYLALALQFFGRRGDQLFHVLVPVQVEVDRGFFYPPPGSEPGIIELVEVPVALLRDYLPGFSPAQVRLGYSELVRQVQQELDLLRNPPKLRVDLPLVARFGDTTLPLSGLPLVLFVALAVRRSRCREDCPGCPRCFVPVSEVQDGGLHAPLIRIVHRSKLKDYRLRELTRWKAQPQHVGEPLKALLETNARIKRRLGDQPSRKALHVTRRAWGDESGYGIPLPPDRIVVAAELAGVWD